jgi:hypothetical protein
MTETNLVLLRVQVVAGSPSVCNKGQRSDEIRSGSFTLGFRLAEREWRQFRVSCEVRIRHNVTSTVSVPG